MERAGASAGRPGGHEGERRGQDAGGGGDVGGAPLPPPRDPTPVGPPTAHLRLERLMFLHWPVDAAVLRARVPEPLEVETFDEARSGEAAWVSVVPFVMAGVRPWGLPAVPWLSRITEVNVRTYVRCRDGATGEWVRGVYFFGLYAASRLAVALGRGAGLPFQRARGRIRRERDGELRYAFEGTGHAFRARARAVGAEYSPAPGSIDSFVADRLRVLWVDRDERVRCGRIDHGAWRLHAAEVDVERNTLLSAAGSEVAAAVSGLNGLRGGASKYPLARVAATLPVSGWRPWILRGAAGEEESR